MKKNLLAAAAAAALMIAASNAGATGWGNPSNSGDTHIDNNNKLENKNYNNVYNKNSNSNNNYNKNSNNNSNKNTNLNANINNNSNKNYNKNSNTNNNNNKSSARANANSNSSSNASGGDGSSSVSVSGDDAAASGAAPVYLTSSNDTCMGSSGIGGQGMSFGFSLGTTWTDSNCIMLKNARELKVQGHEKAAKARLCMDSDNAMAFELAGEPCPRALKTSQAAVATMREYNPDYMTAATTAPAAPAATQTAQTRTPAVTPSLIEAQE